MSHAFRLTSVIAACVIPLATAAANDLSDLDQRFQIELDSLVETKLNKLLEAKLEAQAASLLARNHHRPATGDEISAIADSADLATRMTCAVSDSGMLTCVAEPVCDGDETQHPTVVASWPQLSSNLTDGC